MPGRRRRGRPRPVPKLGPLKLTIYRFDLEGRDTGSGSLRDRVLRGIFDSSGTRIDGTWDDDGGEGYNAPHLDQNVLGRLRRSSPGLDSGLAGGLFSRRPHGPVSAYSLIWRKRGTRKSRSETKTENEACSALLARLWCHLILQNPSNRAENLTRLCSATICKTGWRMVQFGAIRSRLETMNNRE